ncbi:MAG: T9SS type A sorting domain-containing protein [Fibrobacter sp.]|jgi:hypothetical protein|nr:T9SS type A sorting domain-containing protein [Fibrobacter sp.]
MIKKTFKLILFTLFLISPGYAQKAYLRGRVVDKDYKAIQGAQVKLVKANMTQHTDWEGKFSFEIDISSVRNRRISDMITFHNGILFYNVSEKSQQLHIEIFDIKGQKVGNLLQEISGKGTFNSKLLPEGLSAAMYFVKLRIGTSSGIFKIMSFKNQVYAMSVHGKKSMMNKTLAASDFIDSLEVSKNDYDTVYQNISSYSSQLPDIVLQSNSTNDQGLPRLTDGQDANTTRYWDCCKPHCGWHSNMKMCDINGNQINDQGARSGCEGGPAFQCMDYAPIEINSKVSYGWAAFNNHGTQCGDCFQLDFQDDLSDKQMIVQVINIGDGGQNAFDLLIPGGGVGALNGCSQQWNNAPLGERYGGFRFTCGPDEGCIRSMCQSAFGNRPDLMRGCEWYLKWFRMADNPKVKFKKVPCPQEIKNISQIGN